MEDAPRSILATDTIAAVSTPPGRGAIAVVRMSGPDVTRIAPDILDPWPILDRVATLCTVRARDGHVLDEALAIFFRAPASFTGEDTLEISTHGGWLTPTLVLATLLQHGAREALPGEFTRRAVLNGHLDILQAEAIGDLIDASTPAMHRAAISQLDGSLSRSILELREQLIDVEALIGYDIDFPEEDDGPVAPQRVLLAIQRAADSIESLLVTAPVGEILREGAVTVIAGRTNAGKSSLFNALVGKARAIVTEIPGTTRDAIEALIDVHGWPVRLVDTAGIRSSNDIVEQLGMEVSERYIESAHLVILCSDGNGDDALNDRIAELTNAPVIRVRTKADLVIQRDEIPLDVVAVSVVTRAGLDTLLERIRQTLRERYGAPIGDAPILTHTRHRIALEHARRELQLFRDSWKERTLPAPIAAVHLREAVHTLEELVGVVEVEDVLDKLFSSFCVGK